MFIADIPFVFTGNNRHRPLVYLVKILIFGFPQNPMIQYKIENDLSPGEFTDVLSRSTLAERRPVTEPARIADMLKHANLIVTARENGILIGVSRALTDFAFCTYLSDLAVDENYQKKGIGKELIRQTKLASPKAKLILLAAPKAVNYYPRIGMTKFEHCFYIDDANQLK
jgi:GNAT superfamily N-acetyltransferase